jgi:zinc protease
MTLLLQSRLLDTIRQELGGTYSITATPDTQRYPRPEYAVRIDWTCDPARTATLVQRVFEEIAFVKGTLLPAGRVAVIRDALLRDFERNSQENGYLLNQITRRYQDGTANDLAPIVSSRDQIEKLTGAAIQQAAETYLDTANYVKVTLMPETKK